MSESTLDTLTLGSEAIITDISPECPYRHRLIDMGFTENTRITALKRSIDGGLTAFFIKGTVLALRRFDTKFINIHYD